MSEEDRVLELIREKGKVTLDDVSSALKVPKYGVKSAYTILDSLRKKGLVIRDEAYWMLSESQVTQPRAERKEEKQPNVSEMVEALMSALTSKIETKKEIIDEWEISAKPMQAAIEEREKELSSYILKPDTELSEIKNIIPFKTGTFLDDFFLTLDGKKLGGIPAGGQFAITGLPGSGKSILVEEIALRVSANGKKVLFVTAEDVWKSNTQRFDLQSRMAHKAKLLGLDWRTIAKNLFVMDAVTFSELRNWETFAEAYRYVVEKEDIDLVIIDSVTLLETYRGALKYRIMELCRYNQLRGITALYVNQRSSETWDSYDMAGGIGLAHNLDGTILVDYGRVYWLDQQQDLNAKRGEFVRIARVLDCRLCGFERKRIRIEISPEGFVLPLKD